MNPRVVKAEPLENYNIYVEFSNQEKGYFDTKKYLDYPVFQELKNIEKFKKLFVSFGTVEWESGQDFCPDTIYLETLKIN